MRAHRPLPIRTKELGVFLYHTDTKPDLSTFIAIKAMKNFDLELEKIKGTELYDHIVRTRRIYASLEEHQKNFCSGFNVHCKSGCGSCCEHFVPDITDLEAEYLEFGLLSEGRDEAVLEAVSKMNHDAPPCPLYDINNKEHHCTVYEYRPLVCRLFGAAASKDKEGHPVFRNCKWNDNPGAEIPSQILESHKENLVVMSDYAMQLEDEEINDTDTHLVYEAIQKAAGKVGLILELEEAEKAGR